AAAAGGELERREDAGDAAGALLRTARGHGGGGEGGGGGGRLVERPPPGPAGLRGEREAGAHRLARRTRRDPPAVDLDVAGAEALDAEQAVGDLGAAAALEAGERDNLPRADLEADVADHVVADAADGEPDVTEAGALARLG